MSEEIKVNEKHLELIQAVITRHNSNSFIMKAWAIAICTAVLTVALTLRQPIIALFSLVPLLAFWILDSLRLANERCFASLYSAAINGYVLKVKYKDLLAKKQNPTTERKNRNVIPPLKEGEIESSPYSMDITAFRKIKENNWLYALKSKTIIWFYLMLIVVSLALFLYLNYVQISLLQIRF